MNESALLYFLNYNTNKADGKNTYGVVYSCRGKNAGK